VFGDTWTAKVVPQAVTSLVLAFPQKLPSAWASTCQPDFNPITGCPHSTRAAYSKYRCIFVSNKHVCFIVSQMLCGRRVGMRLELSQTSQVRHVGSTDPASHSSESTFPGGKSVELTKPRTISLNSKRNTSLLTSPTRTLSLRMSRMKMISMS
jgi:hypothetical protein